MLRRTAMSDPNCAGGGAFAPLASARPPSVGRPFPRDTVSSAAGITARHPIAMSPHAIASADVAVETLSELPKERTTIGQITAPIPHDTFTRLSALAARSGC